MMFRPALLFLALLAPPVRADNLLILPIPPSLDSRQIGVTVEAGLTRTRSLPPGELRTAREAMLADQDLDPALLRALADRRDGLAALRLTRALVADGGATSDIAYYGAIAVLTGRIWPLEDVIAAMQTLDPATEPTDRVNMYIAAIYPQAWAGNALALDALITLNGPGRLFGDLSDRTRARIVEMATQAGDGRIFLHLAISDLWEQPDAAMVARAETYLLQAAAGSHLGVRTAAQTILVQRGLADPAAIAAPVMAEPAPDAAP